MKYIKQLIQYTASLVSFTLILGCPMSKKSIVTSNSYPRLLQTKYGQRSIIAQHDLRHIAVCDHADNAADDWELTKWLLKNGDSITRGIVFNQRAKTYDIATKLLGYTKNDEEKYHLIIAWLDTFTVVRDAQGKLSHSSEEEDIIRHSICPLMLRWDYPEYYANAVTHSCSSEHVISNDLNKAIYFSTAISEHRKRKIADIIAIESQECK